MEIKHLIAIVTALLFVAVASGAYTEKRICEEKTKRIGMASEWSFFGGCLIEEKIGVWVPLENYRSVNE